MNFVKYQLPLFLWASLIFCVSSLHTLPPVETPIISADKIAHFGVFFIFCGFSYRALFFQQWSRFFQTWSLTSAFFLTCFYGYLDEVHQLFVPGRTYDLYDFAADALGGLFFVLGFYWIQRWKNRQKASVDNA